MNTKDKNINSTTGDRRTYLSPRTEIIKMATNAGMMEIISIPRKDGYTEDAYGKKWQGDDLDSWDEADANYGNNWGSVW